MINCPQSPESAQVGEGDGWIQAESRRDLCPSIPLALTQLGVLPGLQPWVTCSQCSGWRRPGHPGSPGLCGTPGDLASLFLLSLVQDFGLDITTFHTMVGTDCPMAFLQLAFHCCSVSLPSLLPGQPGRTSSLACTGGEAGSCLCWAGCPVVLGGLQTSWGTPPARRWSPPPAPRSWKSRSAWRASCSTSRALRAPGPPSLAAGRACPCLGRRPCSTVCGHPRDRPWGGARRGDVGSPILPRQL